MFKANTVIDGRVFFQAGEGEHRYLRVFAGDLPDAAKYINAHHISAVMVETTDPLALLEYPAMDDGTYARSMRSVASDEIDLTPLAQCPQIEALSLEGNLMNSESLACLPGLKVLSIDNRLGREAIQLDRLPALMTLWLRYYGKNIKGLGNCANLKRIRIWNYTSKSRSLSDIAGMCALEEAEWIQPRIDTLDGIEALSALKRIAIYYSRTLRDVSAIGRCDHPVELELDHVPKVDLPQAWKTY